MPVKYSDSCKQWFSDTGLHENHLGCLLNTQSWTSLRCTELEYLGVQFGNVDFQQVTVILTQVVLPPVCINAVKNADWEVVNTHAK